MATSVTSTPALAVSLKRCALSGVSGSTLSPSISSLGATAATVSSPGCSPILMVSVVGALSRITFMGLGRPGSTAATRFCRSVTSLMDAPPNSVMMSPDLRPPASAGLSFMTSETSTPLPGLTPKPAASSGVRSWMAMPSQPRTTRPFAMSWVMMSLAMLIGIENPMPWPVETMAVLMPITRPSRFSSGPPELPG